MIRTATGAATGTKLDALVTEALGESTEKFEAFNVMPKLALLFLSPRFELESAIRAVRASLPNVQVVGCTTAGELSELGLTLGGLSIMLIGGSGISFKVNVERAMLSSPPSAPERAIQRAGRMLEALKDKNLAALDSARLTSLILTDGMSQLSETIVDNLQGGSSAAHELFGGGAADEGNFFRTDLGTSRSGAFSDGAIAVHFSSSTHWGIGVCSGFSAMPGLLRVTKAEGNVIHELNGKPAFEFYRDQAAASGVILERQDAPAFILRQPLGIMVYDRIRAVRMPYRVLESGSIVCTGDIPQGATARLLVATTDSLVAATRAAARTARERLGSTRAAGVLVFDSVLVHRTLQHQYTLALDQVRDTFVDTPIAGFLSYGEVARYSATLSGWHNASTVVVAIPDCA